MLASTDLRHLNSKSDSEVLLNVFAHELQKIGQHGLMADRIFNAITQLHKRVSGGYAVVSLVANNGLVAFRDPNGIRPLVLGKRDGPGGIEYMIASESVALDALDFERVRDVIPGEAIYIDNKGRLHSQVCTDNSQWSPCIFEYVYLARPDSVIDGISVYKARLRMGEKLAEKIIRENKHNDIDVVIPIPDTSRTPAVQVAHGLGVKFREGFIKNRYIPRTFIMPGQEMREKSVKQKLNAIDLEFKDKNVLLVDDSIVRGTTSREIIKMARRAGAKKVFFASAAPPVRHPNVYGINMPTSKELIAFDCEEKDVEALIGADWLVYQDLDALTESVVYEESIVHTFDTSCFSGKYVTGDVTAEYLKRLAESNSG
jgi:amidophosphoribosyltransferase